MRRKRPKDTAHSRTQPVVRLDYWNTLECDAGMDGDRRLAVEVVAQQRTIEAMQARLYQDRIDHGQAMYRAQHAEERRRWMAEQARQHEAEEAGEEA